MQSQVCLVLLSWFCMWSHGGSVDYDRWGNQGPLSGLCYYGNSVECCWGWRRTDGGRCQPHCQQGCKHGECVGPDRCRCHPGYTGKACNQDLNECGVKPRPCKHRCMNTLGSYKCYCLDGYTLQADGSCRNARTCYHANCQYGCKVTKGAVQCTCPSPGLRLGPDRRTCVDVNECVSGGGVCPHRRKCVNTFGSFVCKCHLGFKLTYINGRYSCIDKDSRPFCSLNPASPKCKCKDGSCEAVLKVTLEPHRPRTTKTTTPITTTPTATRLTTTPTTATTTLPAPVTTTSSTVIMTIPATTTPITTTTPAMTIRVTTTAPATTTSVTTTTPATTIPVTTTTPTTTTPVTTTTPTTPATTTTVTTTTPTSVLSTTPAATTTLGMTTSTFLHTTPELDMTTLQPPPTTTTTQTTTTRPSTSTPSPPLSTTTTLTNPTTTTIRLPSTTSLSTSTVSNRINKEVTHRQRGDVHIPRHPGQNQVWEFDIELGNTAEDTKDDPEVGVLRCTFDHGMCDWMSDKEGDVYWETAQNTEGDRYLSVPELKAGQRSTRGARLVVQIVPPWSHGDLCFSFSHWLTGHHVGVLQLFVRKSGQRYDPALWSRTGGHGWRHTQVSLTTHGVDKVLLKADRRRGQRGQMAVDDVTLRQGACQ